MDDQHSDLLDLIPAYALDALSAEEKARIEAILATSEAARAELETYQAMIVGFATLTPKRKAPPHLNDAFRARLAAEAGSTTPTRPQLRVTRTQWLLAAAVLAVAIGLAYFLTTVLDREGRAIRDILNDPAATRVTISAQDNPENRITVVMLPNSRDAVLVAELPTLPAEQQYQLWWLYSTSNVRWSLSVFSVEQRPTQVLIKMPADPDTDIQCGVTIEPAGGSPSPTTKPVVVGKLIP